MSYDYIVLLSQLCSVLSSLFLLVSMVSNQLSLVSLSVFYSLFCSIPGRLLVV